MDSHIRHVTKMKISSRLTIDTSLLFFDKDKTKDMIVIVYSDKCTPCEELSSLLNNNTDVLKKNNVIKINYKMLCNDDIEMINYVPYILKIDKSYFENKDAYVFDENTYSNVKNKKYGNSGKHKFLQDYNIYIDF